MIEVGTLKINDVFFYKDYTYKVIDKNNIFIVATRIEFDGITRYFLHSIEVKKLIKKSFFNNNPNHDITVRYAR